ncbi:transcriptional regulator [Streptomyces sp. NPDC005962]|uniref:transcriptional regulator n=1 Tax=Streptomyces sp. NPDC005962 TaxID=3154466 RepID=UPI0033CB1064
MPRPVGNVRLKSARQAAGYASQEAFAEAIRHTAPQLGIRSLQISVRQVRRWESASPPWPQPDVQRVLTHLLGQSMEELGFTAPWGRSGSSRDGDASRRGAPAIGPAPGPLPIASNATQPATAGADFAAITAAHRRLYWSVQPSQLHASVVEHTRLGTGLMGETSGRCRTILAAALAESYLLAGRIDFFDLQRPEAAGHSFVRGLQAAGEADDALLGAAILAHTAFIPGWAGQREDAEERMSAARAYARRGNAPAMMLAWLDAVEAECMTRCGDTRTALRLIAHAEDVLAEGDTDEPCPVWMDWFTPVRLAAFKGNTQLIAGHTAQARATLVGVLDNLPADDGKQRTIILGDLAAVEAAAGKPEEACRWANEALDQLSATWYAAGMDRIRDVRKRLHAWRNEPYVRDLDDRMYGWGTTVSALQR